MVTHQLGLVLQHLRKTIRRQAEGALADGALLERFISQRDEAAFEVLVWRHGPLLLSLCQRLIQNSHDAEDVLQATFLTLVKKAGSIGKRAALGSWLYKVAYRMAVRTRNSTRKSTASAAPVEELPAAPAGDSCHELRLLLDPAIAGLPERYRTAVVLCYLQGKTHKEIAEELSCPLGTISTRLARARQMLRKYLARRGVVLPSVMLGAMLAQHAVSAAVGPPLVFATVKAAASVAAGQALAGAVTARVAALTEGMLKAMFLTKAKVLAALLLAFSLVCAGGAVLLQGAAAEAPADVKKPIKTQTASQPSRKSTARLQALWADLAGSDEARVARAILALAATPRETVAFLKEQLPPLKADRKLAARLLADLDSDRFAVRRKAMADLEYLGPYVKADLTKALAGKPSAEARRSIQELLNKIAGGHDSTQRPHDPERPADEVLPLDWGAARAKAAANKIRELISLGKKTEANALRRELDVLLTKMDNRAIAGKKPDDPARVSLPPSALWVRAVRAVVVLEHIATPAARQVLETVAQGEADALPTKEARAAVERLKKKSE
jgi:RNA polymerase sigma factor (sigma-70 family)